MLDWSSSNWNLSDGETQNGGINHGVLHQITMQFFQLDDATTGASSIAADLDVTLLGLTVGEGDITISAGSGSLTLSDSADFQCSRRFNSKN